MPATPAAAAAEPPPLAELSPQPPPREETMSHADWSFLPPTALQVMAGSLPPSTLLKARLVCRHWRHCLAATVEALYIVPEFFVNEALTQQLPLAYPKATTVAIDLQDTFMAVPEEPAQGGGPDSDGAAGGQAGAPQQPALVAHPIAALAAAFAAGFANANQAAQAVAAAQAAVAAQVQLHQGQGAIIPPPPPPPPTVTKSVVPTTPVPGVLVPGCRHLRLRLPDQTDVEATAADVNASWQYVSNLLSMEGSRLQSLSLSIAPGPASITVLSALTHLTALTMDEASHLAWGNEHIPTVGLLSNLRSLTIKIPPFRTRPEQPTNGVAPNPGLLASWGQLTQLTRLHVCAMRYSYHASLVAVLPAFKRLESLALRAPQTRLPWPGTDRPVFNHIGMLTGLTQLSLALADHIMAPQNWQALSTLSRLTSLELSVSENSESLGMPAGLEMPSLRTLKLRYPNSQDLVRIAAWTNLQRLDMKFPEHERELHQERACIELSEAALKMPLTAGALIIASVLASGPGGASCSVHSGGGGGGALGDGGIGMPPGRPCNARGRGHTSWWSPLLPLLALPNISDFRCSAKEGLASRAPILFDEVLAAMCASWPAVTRLAFKGSIDVLGSVMPSPTSPTGTSGWEPLRNLAKLQQLELRHHPPQEQDEAQRQQNGARPKFVRVDPIRLPATALPDALQALLLENVELRRKETDCLSALTSLERRTTCRHFPEFEGMPLQRLVVSNCCVKAKGISSIAAECGALTHLVFAVYKVTEPGDLLELQNALRQMVRSLPRLSVLKVRLQAACVTQGLLDDMVAHTPHLQRLKLTSSDGWEGVGLFEQLVRLQGLRKCSLAYFKTKAIALRLRDLFRAKLPYCKLKAKHEAV